MFDTLFGLPAHSLLIHAPIVLLPLVALATIVFVVNPKRRERAGWSIVAATFVVLVLLFAAKESGESFSDAFDVAFGPGAVEISRHEELANATFVLTLLWFVVVAGWIGFDGVRRRRDLAPLPVVGHALGGVASALAVLATVWLIRTGHEGADVVWGPVVPQLFPE